LYDKPDLMTRMSQRPLLASPTASTKTPPPGAAGAAAAPLPTGSNVSTTSMGLPNTTWFCSLMV